jgi:hypothetical protein
MKLKLQVLFLQSSQCRVVWIMLIVASWEISSQAWHGLKEDRLRQTVILNIQEKTFSNKQDCHCYSELSAPLQCAISSSRSSSCPMSKAFLSLRDPQPFHQCCRLNTSTLNPFYSIFHSYISSLGRILLFIKGFRAFIYSLVLLVDLVFFGAIDISRKFLCQIIYLTVCHSEVFQI